MNEYGLDVNYFKEKLSLILRDIGCYNPEEMHRELLRLASVVEPSQAQQTDNKWISLRNDDYSYLKGNELIYAYRHGQGIFEARLENYQVVSDVIFNRNVNGVTHIMVRPPLPCPPSAEKVFNDEIHRPWALSPAPKGGA